MEQKVGSAGERHFGLDWLRVIAFSLVVFHHVGMYFGPEAWIVQSPDIEAWAIWPMVALQPWRMPLLFAVSGYASFALLSRGAGIGNFATSRSLRLLLPLLFGMLVLVPPQSWARLSAEHGYVQSLWHYWLNDWGRTPLPGAAGLSPTEHLWFLAYLWTYTMLLLFALAATPEGLRRQIGSILERLFEGHRLLWLPLFPLLGVRVAVLFTIPEKHGLLHDWVSDVTFLPAFLFGFALASQPAGWAAVHRVWRPAAIVAATAFLLLVAIEYAEPGDHGHFVQALDRDSSLAMGWSMILLLFGAAHRWLNRDHPLRKPLCEAVFPCYLVHQTIIVLVGLPLSGWDMSNAARFALLVTATFGGSWLFYRMGARADFLRPMFGLSPPPRPRQILPTAPSEPPSFV